MFSNGSEAQSWQSRNCYRCWKYNAEGTERDGAMPLFEEVV